MTYDDFCKLTFEEFEAVYEAYAAQRDTEYKDRWCRMRLLATITLQPHLQKGKRLTPEKLLPLPWDKLDKPGGAKDAVPKLTPEQQRARMENLVKKLGDEMI